jgi:hypothetical protein
MRAFLTMEDMDMKTFRILRNTAALAALATAAALVSTAAVADGPQAISTAATHAGMAAGVPMLLAFAGTCITC